MHFLLGSHPLLVFTLPSLERASTGSLVHQKTLLSVYVYTPTIYYFYIIKKASNPLTTIKTTAVGSLLVGSVISKIEAEHPGVYKPEDIAHALSFLAGAALFVLGILRLGWLIEFIPYVPISAFVTSASITIISTQLPTVLGITGVNTREAPYRVYVNTLKGLPRTKLDAAIGITCIILLHAIRSACARMELRQPAKKRVWSLLSSLRLTFAILLYTFISWLVHRKTPAGQEKFRIVGHIDKGTYLPYSIRKPHLTYPEALVMLACHQWTANSLVSLLVSYLPLSSSSLWNTSPSPNLSAASLAILSFRRRR